MAGKPIRIFCLMFILLLGVGCSDPIADSINLLSQQNTTKLTSLGQQLDRGQIRNAMLLSQYAKILTQQRPELTVLYLMA